MSTPTKGDRVQLVVCMLQPLCCKHCVARQYSVACIVLQADAVLYVPQETSPIKGMSKWVCGSIPPGMTYWCCGVGVMGW